MKLKLEKLFAWAKWLLAIATQGLLFLISIVIYPILIYPTRGLIRKLWYDCGKFGKIISFLGFIFLNDPDEDGECDDYGTEQYRKSLGYEGDKWESSWFSKWWISYNWSGIRNWAWNVHRFLRPKYNYWEHKYTIETIKLDAYSNLTTMGGFNTRSTKKIKAITIPYYAGLADPMDMCVLKYKFEDGSEADNFGTVLDLKKSVLGKIFVYYRVNGVLYFRYSRAWYDPNRKIAREIQFGSNGTRFKIRNKLKLNLSC